MSPDDILSVLAPSVGRLIYQAVESFAARDYERAALLWEEARRKQRAIDLRRAKSAPAKKAAR